MEDAAFLNDSGIALTEANRPGEAVFLFERALVIEPENPLLWFNLGVAYQRLGDYDNALECYGRAVDYDGGMSDAWGFMGLIHYELEQFEAAENCYHTAISTGNAGPKIWNNLGVLYFTQGDYEAARHCFEEALILMPDYFDALFNLRDSCRELGDSRAADEFERVLSSMPAPDGVKGFNSF